MFFPVIFLGALRLPVRRKVTIIMSELYVRVLAALPDWLSSVHMRKWHMKKWYLRKWHMRKWHMRKCHLRKWAYGFFRLGPTDYHKGKALRQEPPSCLAAPLNYRSKRIPE